MPGKKIRRRPKQSSRLVSVRETTVRRLAALMDRHESFGDAITRAVEALERWQGKGGPWPKKYPKGKHTLGVKGPHKHVDR